MITAALRRALLFRRRPDVRRRVGVLAVSAVVAVTAVAGSTAPAGAVEIYPRAANNVLTLQGHGFGHGHGMSQYGAYGAALKGIGWQQIVDHYYPGTTRTNIGNPVIRVDVRGDVGNRVAFGAAPGLWVSAGTGHVTPSVLPTVGPGNSPVVVFQVVAVDATTSRLLYLTAAGGWYQWGGATTQFNVTNRSSGVVQAWGTSGQVSAYRGELRSIMVSGAVAPVAALPMEEYLRGVVPHESPASWPANALAAQAVAARSYAAYSLAHPRSAGYDICASTSCQVYSARGFVASTDAAIKASAGVILSYQGAAAFTEFSSSTGGWNSKGSQPYLVAQADPWDGVAANPNRNWTVTIPVTSIQSRWSSIGTFTELRIVSRDGAGDWGGRVTSALLVGSKGSVSVSGATLQSAFGLKSTYFTPVNTNSAPSFPRDYSSDGKPDFMWVYDNGSGGVLNLSRGDGLGHITGTSVAATGGWAWVRAFSAGTWDGDSVADVMTVDTAGNLYFWSGRTMSAGGRKIATGMNQYDAFFPVGDFNGDHWSDFMARRKSDGALVLYSTNGSGGLAVGAPVVSGNMSRFTSLLGTGDFDGDGRVDIIARTGADLILFSGNGSGGWLRNVRIGTGWSTARQWFSPGDFTGDGKPDLMALMPDGSLRMFIGSRSGFSGTTVVTQGLPMASTWLT